MARKQQAGGGGGDGGLQCSAFFSQMFLLFLISQPISGGDVKRFFSQCATVSKRQYNWMTTSTAFISYTTVTLRAAQSRGLVNMGETGKRRGWPSRPSVPTVCSATSSCQPDIATGEADDREMPLSGPYAD